MNSGELQYMPMRSNRENRIRKEPIEERRQQTRAEKRKIEEKKVIRGRRTLATLGLIGAVMIVVVPKEQAKQREKVAQERQEIMQEIEQEKAQRIIELQQEKETEVLADVKEEMKSFKTTEENIKQNIKEKYLEQYNEENNTDYTVDNLNFSYLSTDYIVKTLGGKYITHGSYPDEVKGYLNDNEIDYSCIDMNGKKVYYSSIDGEILEMMTAVNGGEYVSVIEGDNIQNKINEYSKNILLDMKDVMMTGMAWANEPENMSLKQNYIDAVVSYKKEEKENEEKEENSTFYEGFEPGE